MFGSKTTERNCINLSRNISFRYERDKSLTNRKKMIYILVRRLTMRLACLETNITASSCFTSYCCSYMTVHGHLLSSLAFVPVLLYMFMDVHSLFTYLWPRYYQVILVLLHGEKTPLAYFSIRQQLSNQIG